MHIAFIVQHGCYGFISHVAIIRIEDACRIVHDGSVYVVRVLEMRGLHQNTMPHTWLLWWLLSADG